MPWPSDYHEHALAAPRSPAVEAAWTFTASTDGIHVVLPDGRMDLIVAFRGADGAPVRDVQPLIVGPSQRWAEVPVARGDRFVGVRFRPGWGGAVLGVDPASIVDDSLSGPPLERLLGADATRLASATTPRALAEALHGVVHRRAACALGPAPTIVYALRLIHASGGRLRLDEVSRIADVPIRTLRRHLTLGVGLSFKAFSSVLRFQRTMRLLTQASAPLDPVDAAIEGGYSDQAHMTREFRRHGGFTPGRVPPLVLVGMPLD
ncbi:AraC family transcriptional regulator [Luteibacter sp. PPL552]